MSAIIPCKYNSVTLRAGERFVLPSGSEIIGISNQANLTSECDVPNVEGMACYALAIPVAEDNANAENLSNISIKGFILNGTRYAFTTPFTVNQATGFGTFRDKMNDQIKNIPMLNGILLERCYQSEYDSGRGNTFYMSFKTISSIGDNISVYGTDSTSNSGSGSGFTIVELHYPSVLRSILMTNSHNGGTHILENCPCS